MAWAVAVAAQTVLAWPPTTTTYAGQPAPRHTTPVSTPSTTPPVDASKPIVFADPTDEPPAELASFYAQKPTWRACKGSKTDKCATITVPIDYAKPEGHTVRIALRKAPALKGTARKGTLFINPGGPGGSGLDFAKQAPTYFSKEVRRAWDIVGFDPRGIGQSGSFQCLRPKDLDAMYAADPTPDSAAQKAAADAAAKARLQGCVRRGGELAVNMSTEHVARDLDIMRAAVGDSHLNYLGVSYGTLLGAIYGRLFTSRVGLMVLDSTVSGDWFDDGSADQADVDGAARRSAKVFDENFAQYVKQCTSREECPLGSDPEAAEAKLTRLLTRLEGRPLRTGVRSLPRLTQGWAVTALREALVYEDAWEDLDWALGLALDGNGRGLAFVAMRGVGRDLDGTYSDATFGNNGLPVSCADWPVSALALADPSPAVLKKEPLWAVVEGGHSAPCVGWPGPIRTMLRMEVAPTTPILVIGNERDPITPIALTRSMASVIVGSRLVEVDAGGHGAYGADNSCADDIVDAYLVRAVAPKDHTRCGAG